MVLNRLIITQGDPLQFHLNHTENGTVYEPGKQERYFLSIKADNDKSNDIINIYNNSQDFDVNINLEEGMYVFEIGLTDVNGKSRVILPAVDERHRPINQIIVLRRINNEL